MTGTGQPLAGEARLCVVSGPSGVGKSTVVRKVVQMQPRIWLSVSATTRHRRGAERDGGDYRFMTTREFAELRESGGFLESAEFAGNWYGTPREPVFAHLESGIPVILEIDLQGARQVKAQIPDALTVFLEPPSVEELHRRLAHRGTEGKAEMARRFAVADTELAAAGEFEYRVINTDVVHTAAQLVRLIDGTAA